VIRREAERLAVDAYSVRDLRRQAKSGECPLEFLRFFCVSPRQCLATHYLRLKLSFVLDCFHCCLQGMLNFQFLYSFE